MSDASDLVPVPTLEELGRRGLARNVTRAYVNRIDGSTREDTRWEVTDAGYAEIREAMAHNADILKNNDALRRQLEHDVFMRNHHERKARA